MPFRLDQIKRCCCILVLFCFAVFLAKAQNITRAEYFIDSDPGFGNANAITINPSEDVTASFAFDISGLSFGFHNLYVRSYVSPYPVLENGSTVVKGGWSLSNVRTFYKENIAGANNVLPNITSGEYFIDNDPGFGNGNNIALTPGTDISSLSFAFDVTAIGPGFHNLYVRFMDGNGRWSTCNIRNFYKEADAAGNNTLPNVVAGEYFIDSDPGFGNANNIPLVPGSDLNVNFTFDITSMTPGFHNLYARFKNVNGLWSHTYIRTFYKEDLASASNVLPNIVQGEYFIDVDPGHGNATAIPVVPGTDIANQSFTADVTSLGTGFHTIYVRFKDDNGRWSHSNLRKFYKESMSSVGPLANIVRLEYFVDTDPGFGNGTPVSLNPATDISEFTFPVDMTNVSIGNHKIYVRAQDAEGKWSLVSNGSFVVEPPAAIYITIGNLSPAACANAAFDIPFTVNMPYGSNNTFTAQLSDANGNFNNPVTIGSLTGSNSDTIRATIPANTPIGNGYRVRILASSPLDTSAVGNTAISVKRVPEQFFVINGQTQICSGTANYQASATDPNTKYTWSLSGGGTIDTTGASASVNWTGAGSHTLSLTPSNGCGNGQVRTLQVSVYAAAPTLVPSIMINNRNLAASNPNTSSVSGYQWYRNDSLIAGAVNSSYVAVIDGIYKVAYTNLCGVGTLSQPVTIITLQSQTIVFDTIPGKTFGDPPFVVKAVASSGLPVGYRIVSGPAVLRQDTITLTGAGTVVVEAYQNGDAVYYPASPVRRSFTVSPDLRAPDLTVSNITSGKTQVAPNDTVTVSWEVANIGTRASAVNWAERIYMQSGSGENKTLLRQVVFSNNNSLDTGQRVSRNAVVSIPAQLNIGNDGVFVVEIVPGTGIQEVAGGAANNTGYQSTAWTVTKLLTLELSVNQITEGATTPVTATVKRTGSLTDPLAVNIQLGHAQNFSVASIVTVPAGQSGASFTIAAPDNNSIDGIITDSVQISAAGFIPAKSNLVLFDNDAATLTISGLPAQAMEGDSIRFTITTNYVSAAPQQVYLSTSSQNRFPLPPFVTIPAGSLSVEVPVKLQQDNIPEIDMNINIIAGAANHNPVSGNIQVKDDDVPGLQLVIQTKLIPESAGLFATQATLKRISSGNPIAFTANLTANLPGNLILPNSISLAAGENEKTFNIGVLDNALVDGQRQVAVTASIFVSSCGCSAPSTSSGWISDTITVSDNDGPALTLSATQLTLPEGLANAGMLRISRNTSTANQLKLDLSSSDTLEATIPATAMIASGQTFVDVPITTKNDGVSDGNKQVYFQATANGFSPGSVWVMVTDLNKPDLLVTAGKPNADSVQAMSVFSYRFSIKNTGAATAPAGVVVRGFLSLDNVLDNTDTLVTEDVVGSSIATGQIVEVVNAARVPNLPGRYKLIFKVNPDLALTELLTTNNTSIPANLVIRPDYTATAAVALPYYIKGNPVPVTGYASRSTGDPAANEKVEVYVITNGLRRTFTATTDAAGNYSTQFVPMANESGHYAIGASFPGLSETMEQDAFDILGVQVNNGNIPQFKVILNDTLSGTVSVQNLSNRSLTDFSLVPVNLPNGARLRFDTIPVISGNAIANLPYKVTGASLSPGTNFEVANLKAVSDEGTIQNSDVFYFCQAPSAYVTADIAKIDVTVSQSTGDRTVEIRLVNKGLGSTGNLTINVPQVNWLQSMTPKVLPSLATGDSFVVVLKFLALPEVPFNFKINGNIGINTQNGNSFAIPFAFEKVAEAIGGIKVTVTDQFTYYTAGEPKVAGAAVTVKNYYSGEVLAQGVTDSSGVFTAAGIPEGKHRIIVEKEKHLSYNGTISIEPGNTVESAVFINYQAVTFSWNVVPTAVQDQYDITLVTQFETHVPVPVVTVEIPKSMPQLSGDATFAFNATLTNHGLITAKDVALNFPTDDPEYEFVTNYVPGDLLAQQSIQVPVIMRRRAITGRTVSYNGPSIQAISEFLGMNKAQYQTLSGAPMSCQGFTSVVYWYKCNLSSGLWDKGGELFRYEGRTCTGGGGGGGGNPPILIGQGGGGGQGFPSCAICPPPHWFSGDPGWSQPSVTEKKSCAECINALIGAAAACGGFGPLSGAVGAASCITGNYLSHGGLSGLSGCIPIPMPPGVDCAKAIADAIAICNATETSDIAGKGNASGNPLSARSSVTLPAASAKETLGAVYTQIGNNLDTAIRAFHTREYWAREYFGDMIFSDAWSVLQPKLEAYVTRLDSIPGAARTSIISEMAGYEIQAATLQSFFTRWNQSLQALDSGVMEPDTQYPGIINWRLVQSYSDSLISAQNYATSLGYTSIEDMYKKSMTSLNELVDAQKQAVCASVSVQFSQQLTMTREAFEGTLEIFNGHPTDAMDSLSVTIQITDGAGTPSNGLFEIQTRSLTNVGDITGTGNISAQQKGLVKFLFIPEIQAAPQAPVVYNFGGSVRYWDPYAKAIVTMPLSSVPITVNPSPNLMLHYFMERNILGDDALTSPAIEPSVPAELAVMVQNEGYGPAVNMTISSSQPKIVDNEKGLAINFNLIGSNFQGQPVNFGVTNINFGTIPALQTRIGEWYFTSSLLGKFVSYKADVVHANSFGNPDLSLVKGIKLHELTKSIRLYGALDDGINDFLVNDIFDVSDIPDIIYFSQGNRTAKVYPAETGNFSSPVLQPTFTNTLTVKASQAGWNYIKLDDPGNRFYDLVSVTRSDGQVIPFNNAWLSFVTLPVSRPPVYENKFHFVDSFPSLEPVSYTVVWKPRNFNVPKVDSIAGVPSSVTSAQVKTLRVVFNKAIDAGTFTKEDLTLTFQGGANIIDSSVVITQIDTATFDVDISAMTTGNGFYAFTVQAANVKDIYGTNGLIGKQATWTQFLNVPTVQAFLGIPPDHLASSYDTIQILFNIPVNVSTVTPARFIISRDGTVQGGTVTIDSVRADNKLFYLSGLGSILTQSGEYELTVDLPNIQGTNNAYGVQQQSIKLTVDNTGPLVLSLSKSDSGAIDPQHVPYVKIKFSEDVIGFNTSYLQLTRNGEVIPLNIAQLSNQDLQTWTAGNFGMLTYPEGDYILTVNMAGVRDASGNFGNGISQLAWSVNRSASITVTNLGVTPDLGYSDSDGITSGQSLNVSFHLNSDASRVTISQRDLSGEVVLSVVPNVSAGDTTLPVSLFAGGNISIKVTASGINGAEGSSQKDLFVDEAPLSAKWLFAGGQSLLTQPDTLRILYSARLLSDTAFLGALQLKRNGSVVPAAALHVLRLNDTVYQVDHIRQASSLAGNYELAVNLNTFSKYHSGKPGQGTALTTWTVLSSNRAPVANAGNDTTVTVSGLVSLNGSASADPDGNPITYRWVAPDGISLNDSTSAVPSFTTTAANGGQTYSFLLIVSDGVLFTTDVVKVSVSSVPVGPLVSVKAYLQGPYNAASGLMIDSLRSKALIPATEPYSSLGFAAVNHSITGNISTVLNVTGNEAIVDWIWMELRSGADATQVVASRPALIRRDGSVVDLDGVSPVRFENAAEGNYYISLRHRNHLGVMTSSSVSLNATSATLIDFTSPATATYGTNARASQNGVMLMWAGDANGNRRVSYNGSNNDKNAVLGKVGLTTSNNILILYDRTDVNMDGRVRYNGASNDKNVILGVVGLTTPNKVIIEQLPN